MESNAAPVRKMIDCFRTLPGVGRKGAQRMAFYILGLPREEGIAFAETIREACSTVRKCSVCCNLTTDELCPICASPKRDRQLVCVVETTEDQLAIERGGNYKGTFHILGGAISPLNGVGPDELNVSELLARIRTDDVKEVILATNSDVEGEATAIYVSKLLKPMGVRVTRLANGLPVGADLQYADSVTLQRALEGRTDF